MAMQIFTFVLICSCAASRYKPSQLLSHDTVPMPDIHLHDVCDPLTTTLEVGDPWKVRSFMGKDIGERLATFVNYINLGGHQYIEIVARDAYAPCLASFGLFITWGKDVHIQSPDWGVAVNSKKIAKCMEGGSALAECESEINDIMESPLELISPQSSMHTFVARGTTQYEGELSEIQVNLLSLLLKQSAPSEHEFLGKPVVKMSVRKACVPGQVDAMLMPRILCGWRCNCMTFSDQFRKDAANLFSDLQHLVALLKSMEATATEDLTNLFHDSAEVLTPGATYKCCCTEMNWKTFCKLAMKDTLTRGGCGSLNELNVQFHSWNNMAKEPESDTIENFGKCMVAPGDPLLHRVRKDTLDGISEVKDDD